MTVTETELHELEVRQERVAVGIRQLRERIRIIREDTNVGLVREIADLYGRLELLKLELEEVRRAFEGADE